MKWLWVMGVLAFWACGGPGNAVINDFPEPDTVCDDLGATSCSLDRAGVWLVIRCSVTDDGQLFWRSSHACEHGCKDGLCLSAEADAGDAVTAGSDTDAMTSPPDAVTKDNGLLPDAGDALPPPDICVPDCINKICGDDGCGGSCGDCAGSEACLPDGSGCCSPECQGKLCGDDGCGGTCGDCPEGTECTGYFQCGPICEPKCEDKECGPDTCDGFCGECPDGKACGPQGLCSICVPQCEDKDCGDDGCGGNCGACPYGFGCKDFKCDEPCVAVCAGQDCGDDGCGGSCGNCLPGEQCIEDQCKLVCSPVCAGKECGSDGCGGTCGKCPAWAWCSPQGECVSDCVAPDCVGKVCGSDGCGGSCGECDGAAVCTEPGQCVLPGDACGGLDDEGWCDGNNLLACVAGEVYVTDCKSVGKNVTCEWLPAVNTYGCFEHGECVPDCAGLECGSDGCGGSCGSCAAGQQCLAGECSGQGPCGDVIFEGCCEDNVLLWCDNGVLWFMDCQALLNPAQQQCGWNQSLGFYDCVSEQTEGPDQFPYYCEGECVPSCAGKQCGDDGCGGTCGLCPAGTDCVENVCQGQGGCGGYSDVPACQGDSVVWCEDGKVFFQDCTDMGAFWHCDWAPDLFVYGCIEEVCIPDCDGKACGDDGCGYVCGYCAVTKYCNDKAQCVFGQGFCGDIDYIGQCEANVVKWCQNGILQQFDCVSLGPTWQCGWYAEGGYYWCLDKE